MTPSKGRGALRLLLKAGAVVGVLLALLVVVFLVGVPVPGEFVRAPLESLLSDVFGVPTRIEGPLHLRTGLVASAEANALVLTDPSSPGAPPLARATQPRVQMDLAALLHRAVKFEEITGRHMELRITRDPNGRSNWDPVITPSGSPAPVTFAGIGQLRVASIDATYVEHGVAKPVKFEVKGFDGALKQREPAKARGTLSMAGHAFAFDASTASLAELMEGPDKTIPLQATVESSGAHIQVKGAYEVPPATFGARVEVTAENADTAFAALGVPARRSGRLDARGRVHVSAGGAGIDELTLRLGRTSLSGNVAVDWRGARPRLTLDVAAEAFDEEPFVAGKARAEGRTAIEGSVELIHTVATSLDLNAKATVGRFIGLVAVGRNSSVEARIDDRDLSIHGTGDILGVRTKVALDYSARDPKRTLTWRLEGGKFSSEKMQGSARPGQLAGTIGGLRGEARGSGYTTRELVASARLDVDARDLRFSWPHDAAPPTEVRLDSARIDIASGRSLSAEVRGQLGRRPCRLKVEGGTLASLLAEERWPLRADAYCRGAKFISRGHLLLKGRRTTGALRFNVDANPIGPFLEPLGLGTDATFAFTAEGDVSLTEEHARLKLDRVRLGRTFGAATASFALDGKRRDSVKLALENLDTTEVAALAPKARKAAPADPLEREVLPAKTHLPELDLAFSTKVARVFGETLHRVRFDAAPRDGALPPTRVEFDWQGVAVAGDVAADLRGARPTVELSVTAKGADLGAALVHAGYKAPPLRAGTIRVSVRGSGVKLNELLQSATADGVVEEGRLGRVEQLIPGLKGNADFVAKLSVNEKGPVRLSANGSAGGLPFDAVVETEPLTQLARLEDRLSATLRATLGETRMDASGKLTLKGREELHLSVSGKRLDRLGQLAAVRLPKVGPYEAAADLAIAADSISVSGLDAKFGKSHVLGTIGVQGEHERPVYTADLRAPVLHLEDLGLHVLVETAGKSSGDSAGEIADEAGDTKRIEALKTRLRAFDAKAALDVERLYQGGKRYASLRTSLTLKAGDLRVVLRDMYVSGGKAQGGLHIDASGSGPRLHVRLVTRGFEYGPLAKALKPKTPLTGTLDLSLDLDFKGLEKPLLGNASGYIDLAIFPRGLAMGAADYWGTGLLHMLQLGVDPAAESKLNCAVGVFDIKDGMVTSRAIFADTTRVRIIGELQANLATRRLSGRLSPHSKNPGLFTVAPSLGIAGTLESPQVMVTPASLITAPLRLFLPIRAFSQDWVNATGVPADGSAGCHAAFKQARAVGSEKPAAQSDPFTKVLRAIFPF